MKRTGRVIPRLTTSALERWGLQEAVSLRSVIALLRHLRAAVSPQPAQGPDGRQPDESLLEPSPAARCARAVCVDQLLIGLDIFRDRWRASLPGFGRRNPPRKEAERLRSADRADLCVVDLLTVQTEPCGTELHGSTVERPAVERTNLGACPQSYAFGGPSPSSAAAVPPSTASRSTSVRPGVWRMCSTGSLTHGYG
jgi:hypothetical protein